MYEFRPGYLRNPGIPPEWRWRERGSHCPIWTSKNDRIFWSPGTADSSQCPIRPPHSIRNKSKTTMAFSTNINCTGPNNETFHWFLLHEFTDITPREIALVFFHFSLAPIPLLSLYCSWLEIQDWIIHEWHIMLIWCIVFEEREF